MARYLTPARLCTLSLIHVYIKGRVTTTSTLHLLDFIATQIGINSSNPTNSPETDQLLPKKDASSYATQLSQWQSILPGQSVYDEFLLELWRLQDADQLQTMFEQLSQLFLPPAEGTTTQTLSRASPIGQYIRRSYVEYTRLQFADTLLLWNAFVTFRAPTHPAWAHRNPEAAAQLAQKTEQEAASFPMATASSHPPSNDPDPRFNISTTDTETLLALSIQQLQKLGGRLPADLKHKLQSWISDQADSNVQSLNHFLAFFEHWRSGQLTMALESLHRYFDYGLAARGQDANVKQYYQYALLHLSVVHADFESWEESLEAMEECVATARENQDSVCLNYALSWLLYLRQAHPTQSSTPFRSLTGLAGGVTGGGENDAIASLKARARECKHWSLLSSTLLEEAKGEMYEKGVSPKSVELILQSGMLNVQHDLRTHMPAETLFQGAMYERLGHAHLATRTIETVSLVHGPNAPLNDVVRSKCRVAYSTARQGQYTTARQQLEAVYSQAKGMLKLQQRVTAFMGMVQLKRSINRGSLPTANQQLARLTPARSTNDPELMYEISLLEIDLLLARQEHYSALEILNTHLQTLSERKETDLSHPLHLLLLKATTFAKAGQSQKGLSIALRAAKLAESCQLLPVLLESLATLGWILMDSGEFGPAANMAEGGLPHAFESGNLALTARLLSLLGQAKVGAAGSLSAPERLRERAKLLREAEGVLERSREESPPSQETPDP
ncbi:hypothetical protein MBLNU230_g6768t1 [Neophaeotheca triangularis]